MLECWNAGMLEFFSSSKLLIRFVASSPVITGIWISMRMTSKPFCSRRSRASWPLLARVTAWPSFFSMVFMNIWFSGSSSTRRMFRWRVAVILGHSLVAVEPGHQLLARLLPRRKVAPIKQAGAVLRGRGDMAVNAQLQDAREFVFKAVSLDWSQANLHWLRLARALVLHDLLGRLAAALPDFYCNRAGGGLQDSPCASGQAATGSSSSTP